METYHSDVIGCFIWELGETSYRRTNETSWTVPLRRLGDVRLRRRRCFIWDLFEMSWRRTTETSLGVLFETYLRRYWDVQETSLRRRHDVLFPGGITGTLSFVSVIAYFVSWFPTVLEHVYMRPEVNSNRFEISNCFEMSFCLHGKLHGDFPNNSKTLLHMCKLYL